MHKQKQAEKNKIRKSGNKRNEIEKRAKIYGTSNQSNKQKSGKAGKSR